MHRENRNPQPIDLISDLMPQVIKDFILNRGIKNPNYERLEYPKKEWLEILRPLDFTLDQGKTFNYEKILETMGLRIYDPRPGKEYEIKTRKLTGKKVKKPVLIHLEKPYEQWEYSDLFGDIENSFPEEYFLRYFLSHPLKVWKEFSVTLQKACALLPHPFCNTDRLKISENRIQFLSDNLNQPHESFEILTLYRTLSENFKTHPVQRDFFKKNQCILINPGSMLFQNSLPLRVILALYKYFFPQDVFLQSAVEPKIYLWQESARFIENHLNLNPMPVIEKDLSFILNRNQKAVSRSQPEYCFGSACDLPF